MYKVNVFQVYYIVLARNLILSFPPRPRGKYCQMICPKISVVSFSIKISLNTQARFWVDGEWNRP